MSAKASVHEEFFSVRSFEVDPVHRLKINILCSLFQEVASNHAQQLGVGYETLQQKNIFWVLSRLLVKVHRLPVWHENIKISTWPKGTHRLFALRDFELYNEAGEVLCQATSCWLMVDASTRKPVRPDQFLQYLSIPDQHTLTAVPDKIEVPAEAKESRIVQVHYTDLDHNQHVNNVQYINWLLDGFSPAFFEKHTLRSLQINFLSEARYGEEVRIFQTQLLGRREFLYCSR